MQVTEALQRPWTYIWVAWIVTGIALELIALATKARGDTLSENVWAALRNPTWGKFLAWLLVWFLSWLVVHFISRGRLG